MIETSFDTNGRAILPGDRVELVDGYVVYDEFVGFVGTVLEVNTPYSIAVEFDERNDIWFHSCGGIGKSNHCLWLYDRYLKVIDERISVISDEHLRSFLSIGGFK